MVITVALARRYLFSNPHNAMFHIFLKLIFGIKFGQHIVN